MVVRPGANDKACSHWYFRDGALLVLRLEDPRAVEALEDGGHGVLLVGQHEEPRRGVAQLARLDLPRARDGGRRVDELEREVAPAEHQERAGAEERALALGETLAVHPRAVRAAEVADLPPAAVVMENGVLAGNARVVQPEVGRRYPADAAAGSEGMDLSRNDVSQEAHGPARYFCRRAGRKAALS